MKQKKMVWMMIAGIVAAAGAIFLFNRKNAHSNHQKPPKGAPQVPVENPGDQSEFPTAPSDSEIG